MCALRAVEQVHLLLLLRSGSAHVALVGVRLRVHNACGLAESADAGTMPETDLVATIRTKSSRNLGVRRWSSYEEGAGGGDQDIAVELVSMRLIAFIVADWCAYPYSWGMDAMTDMVAVFERKLSGWLLDLMEARRVVQVPLSIVAVLTELTTCEAGLCNSSVHKSIEYMYTLWILHYHDNKSA